MKLKLLPQKQFFKDYRLPLQATFVFGAIIFFMLFSRAYERIALANVLDNSDDKGSSYATLLSSDKTDDLKKNDVESAEESKKVATTTVTPPTFTISPSTPPPAPSPSEPAPTPPTSPTLPPAPPPFTAIIEGIVVLESSFITCPSGSISMLDCSKTYKFRGVVKTDNGPGQVKYRWLSNRPDVNHDGSFDVDSGTTYTPLREDVTIPCSQPQTFFIQLKLIEPTEEFSNQAYQSHSCATGAPGP